MTQMRDCGTSYTIIMAYCFGYHFFAMLKKRERFYGSQTPFFWFIVPLQTTLITVKILRMLCYVTFHNVA